MPCRMCSKCLGSFNIDEFVVGKKIAARCRKCRLEIARLYRNTHKDSISESKKKCYLAKIELYNFRNRLNASKSPQNFISSLYSSLKKRAKLRKYVKFGKNITRKCVNLEVSVNDIVNTYYAQNGKCAITNVMMEHKPNKLTSISIDRINSSKGYVSGNIQLVCQFINLGKHDKSNIDVLNFINNLRRKLNGL